MRSYTLFDMQLLMLRRHIAPMAVRLPVRMILQPCSCSPARRHNTPFPALHHASSIEIRQERIPNTRPGHPKIRRNWSPIRPTFTLCLEATSHALVYNFWSGGLPGLPVENGQGYVPPFLLNSGSCFKDPSYRTE